jgi:hypothetical protein
MTVVSGTIFIPSPSATSYCIPRQLAAIAGSLVRRRIISILFQSVGYIIIYTIINLVKLTFCHH